MVDTIFLDGKGLTISEVSKVGTGDAEVQLTDSAKDEIKEGRRALKQAVRESEDSLYGITTGFGHLVNEDVDPGKRRQLQENLIRSHSSGVGDSFPREIVRAAMVLRINSLARGNSGIRLRVVRRMVQMLNEDVVPLVPRLGSLGASGDLAPLAHLASVLSGFGRAEFEGEVYNGEEALSMAGIEPVELRQKEGLALINGTQFMAGSLCISIAIMNRLLTLADVVGAFTVAVLGGNEAQFDRRIQNLRPFPGQKKVARNIRNLVGYARGEGRSDTVQDAYSIRCIPQVHGAVRTLTEHVSEILRVEINSVTDNPLIFTEPLTVLSGGNFHGEPIAFGADYLKLGLVELGTISERRINRLLHPDLNGDLPPFLTDNPGVNSGYMMAQYTAASLVSENRSLASPASIDSIPVSGDQEDHVSMGMTAVTPLAQMIENLSYVISIELLVDSQAQDFRSDPLSPPLEKLFDKVRERVPFLEEDSFLHKFIERTHSILQEEGILAMIEKECGPLA